MINIESFAPRFFLSFILVTQLGCAGYSPVGREAPRVNRVQAVKREVASIRGLSFSSEVSIEVKKKDGIRRYLEADLITRYGEWRLHNLSLVYAKLGLLPQGLELKDSSLDFYAARALGFYDPRAKKLVLREDLGRAFVPGPVRVISQENDLGGRVLAHELAHALQDQHFSLEHRLGPSSNDDRTLAFRAVAEGDATLVEYGYLLGGVGEGFVAQVNQRLHGKIEKTRSDLSGVPRVLADRFLFQYFAGASFVSRLLAESGWSGINRLYDFPPLSTEQVLHPEKYLYEPDPPTRVDINGLSPLYPPGWIAIGSNTLGEVMVRCLFDGFVSPPQAEAVAGGWDGDRYWAFRKGEEVSFIWVTVWDSFEDAKEFIQTYKQILAKKYEARNSTGSPFYIEQREDIVMVVEGLEKSWTVNHIEPLWQRLELEEESFNPPVLTSFPAAQLWLEEPEMIDP